MRLRVHCTELMRAAPVQKIGKTKSALARAVERLKPAAPMAACQCRQR